MVKNLKLTYFFIIMESHGTLSLKLINEMILYFCTLVIHKHILVWLENFYACKKKTKRLCLSINYQRNLKRRTLSLV